MRKSEKSKRGFKYRVANGEEIPNEGEKWLAGYGDGWMPIQIAMQVTPVKRYLLQWLKFAGPVVAWYLTTLREVASSTRSRKNVHG